MSKFRAGDLVLVKDGIHPNDMPEHRMALVLCESENERTSKGFTSFYEVAFVGTNLVLKIHQMFLEHLTSS